MSRVSILLLVALCATSIASGDEKKPDDKTDKKFVYVKKEGDGITVYLPPGEKWAAKKSTIRGREPDPVVNEDGSLYFENQYFDQFKRTGLKRITLQVGGIVKVGTGYVTIYLPDGYEGIRGAPPKKEDPKKDKKDKDK